MLCLVIGDFCVPFLARDIPAKFKSILTPGKIDRVLCVGNLSTREMATYLKSICPDVSIVRGQLDLLSGMDLPEEIVLKVGNFSIGLTHGHQLLPPGSLEAAASLARRLDVDVLITGHPTFRGVRVEHRTILSPGRVRSGDREA